MDIVSLLISFALGAIASWAITYYYYRRTIKDSADALLAQRLDSCNEADKAFLVAMLDADKLIPLYAIINIEFETHNGRKGSYSGNTPMYSRSVNVRAKDCTQQHSGNRIDEDRNTISLTKRGRENAQYLLHKEFKWARFSKIDDSDDIRLGLFQYEHKRAP